MIVPPGLRRPAALGRFDHREADPVLHRTAGVERLQLGEDQGLRRNRTEVAGDPGEPDERRPADEVQDRFRVLHRAEDSPPRVAAGYRKVPVLLTLRMLFHGDRPIHARMRLAEEPVRAWRQGLYVVGLDPGPGQDRALEDERRFTRRGGGIANPDRQAVSC